MEDLKLELERKYKTSPEKLFQALTDPEMLKEWFCPEEMTVRVEELDLKVDGNYKIVMKSSEGKEFAATGKYVEIDEPNKVVMTWEWDHHMFDDGESMLTLELEEMGDETQLRLTHSRLNSEESKKSHTEGWTSAMENLQKLLG